MHRPPGPPHWLSSSHILPQTEVVPRFTHKRPGPHFATMLQGSFHGVLPSGTQTRMPLAALYEHCSPGSQPHWGATSLHGLSEHIGACPPAPPLPPALPEELEEAAPPAPDADDADVEVPDEVLPEEAVPDVASPPEPESPKSVLPVAQAKPSPDIKPTHGHRRSFMTTDLQSWASSMERSQPIGANLTSHKKRESSLRPRLQRSTPLEIRRGWKAPS